LLLTEVEGPVCNRPKTCGSVVSPAGMSTDMHLLGPTEPLHSRAIAGIGVLKTLTATDRRHIPMEWNACKRRYNLRFFHSHQRRPKFAQEHALGTAQGGHLMVIEYLKTPAPRLCQNTFRMAGKECPGGPFCFNIHIEFGPQLRRIVQKPTDTPRGRGRILLLIEQNADPG